MNKLNEYVRSPFSTFEPQQRGGLGGVLSGAAVGLRRGIFERQNNYNTTQYQPISQEHWTGFGSWGDTNFGSGEGQLNVPTVFDAITYDRHRVNRGGLSRAFDKKKTVYTERRLYKDVPRYDLQADRRQTADVGYSPFFVSGSGGYQPMGQRHQRSLSGYEMYGSGGSPMLGLSGFGGAPSGLGGFGGFGGGVQGKLSY